LVLDADGYRERRLRSLTTLAHNMADKAVRSGKTVQLRPMSAADRRVIHIALRADERVKTQSSGGGHSRAVAIIPVDSDEG
jgi:spoIIIJ-associated protein